MENNNRKNEKGVLVKCFLCGKVDKKEKRGARNLKYCSRECYQKDKWKPYIAPKFKICNKCKKKKSINQYFVYTYNGRGRHESICKKCHQDYSYDWKKKYPERARELVRNSNYKLRRKILEHYGGKNFECNCCNEDEEKFLQIDHIDNSGLQDRKINGYGSGFYRHIIKNNFPKNLQILCANCNQAKSNYGKCPHKQ